MRNEFWLVVLSLLVVSTVASTGCKGPSSEPAEGAVKGKNLTYDAPSGDYSIVYPSKWQEVSEETETGTVLTTEPRLEVGKLPKGDADDLVGEVIGDATPVGDPKMAQGVMTGVFEGDSDGVPVTWYVRLVQADDGWVYAAVRDDREGFEKSRVGYVKVVDGLTVHAGEPVEGRAVEISPETLAESEKLARFLLKERTEVANAEEIELDSERREFITSAATTFSVAQLCEWSWEGPLTSWSKSNLDDLSESERPYASALFGASNQVILTHLKESGVACDEALEAKYRPKFEAMSAE